MDRIWVVRETSWEEVEKALKEELQHESEKAAPHTGHECSSCFAKLRGLVRILLMPVPYAHLQILTIGMLIWLYALVRILA